MEETNKEAVSADEQVRISGEALAVADNDLRKAIQAGDDCRDICARFVTEAITHVKALAGAGLNADAFNCSITALLTLEVYKVAGFCNAEERLTLLFIAVDNFMSLAETMPQLDEIDTDSHRATILSYLASLVYYNYTLANSEFPDADILPEVYVFLKTIMPHGIIQSPTIVVGGETLDPAVPAPILGDIISRLAALGLYA